MNAPSDEGYDRWLVNRSNVNEFERYKNLTSVVDNTPIESYVEYIQNYSFYKKLDSIHKGLFDATLLYASKTKKNSTNYKELDKLIYTDQNRTKWSVSTPEDEKKKRIKKSEKALKNFQNYEMFISILHKIDQVVKECPNAYQLNHTPNDIKKHLVYVSRLLKNLDSKYDKYMKYVLFDPRQSSFFRGFDNDEHKDLRETYYEIKYEIDILKKAVIPSNLPTNNMTAGNKKRSFYRKKRNTKNKKKGPSNRRRTRRQKKRTHKKR